MPLLPPVALAPTDVELVGEEVGVSTTDTRGLLVGLERVHVLGLAALLLCPATVVLDVVVGEGLLALREHLARPGIHAHEPQVAAAARTAHERGSDLPDRSGRATVSAEHRDSCLSHRRLPLPDRHARAVRRRRGWSRAAGCSRSGPS